jgi:putative hemolysin
MEFAIVFALIALNGLFAMSEIALVTARKTRLQKLVDEGDAGAAAAVQLGKDPTRFLSTIQIGITSIGVPDGIGGEAALAAPLAARLALLGVPAPYGSYVASNPCVRLLSMSTHGLLRLLGVKQAAGGPITEDEIHATLAEGTHAGVMESHEHAMVRNVFRPDDRQIGSLTVPRGDVVLLDASLPFEENLARIKRSDHVRLPVARGGLNDVVGVVNARKWRSRALRDEGRQVGSQPLKAPLDVLETITGMELLDNFRTSDVHMAFVIDEYGEVQGILTLQNPIEAITGEFRPRDAATSWPVQREDGTWLLDGHIPVPELKDRLGPQAVPDEERGRCHTLSGMRMLLTGRLPKAADTVDWGRWRLEIVDMDGKTIDKLLATGLPEQSAGDASDGAAAA